MSLPDPRSDSHVLITGASAGIGTELARQLAARGHDLALVARRDDRLEKLAGELRSAHGVDVSIHPCDLADDAARAGVIDELQQGARHVSALANNAGFGTFGKFWELPREREAEMVRLNCQALVELTHAFLPAMVQRGEGAILEVGSLAAYQPMPMNATYSATKAFVQSFGEAVAAELGGTGVSLTVLCPGPVSTEFGEVAGVGDLESNLPGFLADSAEDVARAGIEGMAKGNRVAFPSMPHQLVAQAGRFTPRTLLLPVVAKVGARTLDR